MIPEHLGCAKLCRALSQDSPHNCSESRWHYLQMKRLESSWWKGLGQEHTMGNQKNTARTFASKATLPFHLLSMPCPPSILHMWKLRTQIKRLAFPKITGPREINLA